MADPRPTDPVVSARLLLRPIRLDDIGALQALYADPLVDRWTGPWTPSSVAAWVVAMVERWEVEGVGKWLALRRTDGRLVGRGGLTRFEFDGEPALELGWVVRDALTRNGYATEMGRAALDWARSFVPDLPVVAFTEVHNAASRAVMERLGMRQVGVIHREGLVEGRPGLHPEAPFAVYRAD